MQAQGDVFSQIDAILGQKPAAPTPVATPPAKSALDEIDQILSGSKKPSVSPEQAKSALEKIAAIVGWGQPAAAPTAKAEAPVLPNRPMPIGMVVNPRTGGLMPASSLPKDLPGFVTTPFDAVIGGAVQVAQGAKNLVTGGVMPSSARGNSAFVQSPVTNRVAALADILEGGMEAASPLILQGLLKSSAAAIETISALASGIGATEAIKWVAHATGIESQYTRLAADLTGFVVGYKGGQMGRQAVVDLDMLDILPKKTAQKPLGATTPAKPPVEPAKAPVARPVAPEPVVDAAQADLFARVDAILAQPPPERIGFAPDLLPTSPERLQATTAQAGQTSRPTEYQGAARNPLSPDPVGNLPVETPTEKPIPRLPTALAGAKPRYGYRDKNFELQFDSDLDRALYVIAQKTPSKQDAAYLKFAMDATGLSENRARLEGALVRDRIKQMASSAPADISQLTVPRLKAREAVQARAAVLGHSPEDLAARVNAAKVDVPTEYASDKMRKFAGPGLDRAVGGDMLSAAERAAVVRESVTEPVQAVVSEPAKLAGESVTPVGSNSAQISSISQIQRERRISWSEAAAVHDELLSKANGAAPVVSEPVAPKSTPMEPLGHLTAETIDSAQPGEYYTVSPRLIKTDPERFQFKSNADKAGVTQEGRIEGRWNESLAGAGTVWKDPATGDLFAVNMHHRLDAAKRPEPMGAKRINIRVSTAATPHDAMIEGALSNVAEGKGNPVDMARILRKKGATDETLRQYGVDFRSGPARQARAIAQLSEPLFVATARGDIEPGIAAAVGESGLSPEGQMAVVKMVDRQTAKGREFTPNQVKALIADVQSAPEVVPQQGGLNLFGDVVQENLAAERAVLRDWSKQSIVKDKRLFSMAANSANAERLAAGGNTIDIAGSRSLADQSALVLDVLDKLGQRKGPVTEAYNVAAKRIAAGENENVVRRDLLAHLKSAVETELGRGAPPGGDQAGNAAGSVPPDANSWSAADSSGRGTGVEDPPAVRDDQTRELFGGIGPPGIPALAKHLVDRVTAEFKKYQTFLSPKTSGWEGSRTSGLKNKTLADIADAEAVRSDLARDDYKRFDKLNDEQQVAKTSTFERTGEFPGDPKYTKIFKESMALAHKWLELAFGEDNVGFIENYVRHAFDFKTTADFDNATAALLPVAGRGSLSANRSVINRRALRMPMDEALKAMRDAGIEVKPKMTNPEDLRQWAVNNAYRALRFKELGDWLKQEKLIQFRKVGEPPKPGMSSLADKRFQVFFRGNEGLIKAGEFVAPTPVKLILDRTISKGWGGNMLFRGIRQINAMENAYQLSISAFHLSETLLTSGASDWALALQQLRGGRPGAAAKSFGRGIPVLSTVRQAMKGHAFRRGVLEGDPAIVAYMQEVVHGGGARLGMPRDYKTGFTDRFVRAWRNNDYAKMIGNGLGVIPEQIAKPLMEWLIPRVKLGAYLDLTSEIRTQLPGAGTDHLMKAYGLASDAMDDRFGELVYDNLNWNRVVVDLGQIFFRALGWTHGSERALFGGIKDVAKGVTDKGQLTERSAFLAAYPMYVALLGGLYQLAHTGTWPSTIKDYFHPKNGLQDPSGNDERVNMKSYVSDTEHMWHDPAGFVSAKRGPLMATVTEIATNRNWFGDYITDPANGWLDEQRWEDMGLHMAQSFVPLSASQFMAQLTGEGGMSQAIERGAAIQPAPRWVVKSPAQRDAEEMLHQRFGDRHKTPDQRTGDQLKAQARIDMSAGKDSPAFDQMMARGEVVTSASTVRGAKQSMKNFAITAGDTPWQRTWDALTTAERAKLIAKYGPAAMPRGR